VWLEWLLTKREKNNYMGKYAKWIGGGIGWALGGPIGGLLGFAAGSLFDSNTTSSVVRGQTTGEGDFVISLLVLVASVMKADGKVVKSELDYVKEYLKRSFGAARSVQLVKMLGDLLKQEIPVRDVSEQIRSHMDYSSRLQFMHFLFGISKADGKVSASEVKLLAMISQYLGITHSDYESVSSMFVANNDSNYKILGVEKSATDEEIKKAYRKMAVIHHPDKVSYLGEDVQNKAEEKFQLINNAYQAIKDERNIA